MTVWRHQVISQANIDPDMCRHIIRPQWIKYQVCEWYVPVLFDIIYGWKSDSVPVCSLIKWKQFI